MVIRRVSSFDLMKVDDARSEAKRQEVKEFYEQTLFSRLNDKQNGAICPFRDPDPMPTSRTLPSAAEIVRCR